MKVKIAQKHQITIPEEICKKAKIVIGDTVDISYKQGKLTIKKIEIDWTSVMKETKGAWSDHIVFKKMEDAIEIVNWIRGK